ncbi:MAG: hypothetical protein CL840_12485 [Crocinitomicaceae bacterium]|nr:hypothetical protein [Crocinitomicaceae bacterium]|tara:strand:- start:3953 stop:4906 length:954 start_codon:yes stop_codon:yes gene_type:complete
MKYWVWLVVFSILVQSNQNAHAQRTYAQKNFCFGFGSNSAKIDFETPVPNFSVIIDSIQGKANQWIIGTPNNKPIDTAYSGNKLIMTDTDSTYKTNDRAAFIIKTNFYFGSDYTSFAQLITGWYWVDTDSLKDYGDIEVSSDGGTEWLSLLSEHNSDHVTWTTKKPVLTGKTKGWEYFECYYGDLRSKVTSRYTPIRVKFTFVSDTAANSGGGLVFDDIHLCEYVSGVFEHSKRTFSSNILPNPAQNQISFSFKEQSNEVLQLKIYNLSGELVKEHQEITSERSTLNVADLPNGIYFYRLFSKDLSDESKGRFLIQR